MTQTISYNYIKTKAKHDRLGYEVELLVPADASHRPAVQAFVQGHYYEAYSHMSFKKILDYKKGGNVVHAGAFFGDMLHTLSLSADTVYAFEPVLENYVFAKKNAERLGLDNVVLQNAGLSEQNGTCRMRIRSDDGAFMGGASIIVPKTPRQSDNFEMVPTFRLDDLPIDNVTLLQLDIEGHEINALRGATVLIEKCQPIILVEDNNHDCAPLLEGLGYTHCFDKGLLNYWATADDKKFVMSIEHR